MINMYQSELGIMSPTAKQQVFEVIDDFKKGGSTDEQASKIVQHAISIAVSYNKRYWNYVNTILEDWLNHSLFDLKNIKSYQDNHSRKLKNNHRNFKHKPTEHATNWDEVKAKETSENSQELQNRLAKMRGRKNVAN